MRREFRKNFLCIVIVVLIASTMVGVISASDVTDLEEQLDENNQQKEELEGEVTELEDYLNRLDEQMETANNEISVINEQIRELEEKIASSGEELIMSQEDVDRQYEQMKLRIKYMYESPQTNYFEAMLESESFADFINKYNYIKLVMDYDRQMLAKLNETTKSIESRKFSLEQEKAELESLKIVSQEKKNTVIKLLSETQTVLTGHQEQIEAFEKKALEYEEQIRQAQLKSATQTGAGTSQPIENTYIEQGDDLKLLATIIYCEAGNQPYEGLLAVGSVVINRVNSPRFVAGTVYDVIMSPNQFAPVASGRFALYYSQGVPERCYQAAREVLDGNITGSWLFFIRADGVRQGDIIGDHVFFYEW